MESASEVVPDPQITPLPMTPPSVLGLFTLRGEIIPLFDTRVLLGLTATSSRPGGSLAGAQARLAVVVHTSEGRGALAANALPATAVLGDPTGPSESRGTAGTYDVDGRAVVLLDLGALLAGREPGAA